METSILRRIVLGVTALAGALGVALGALVDPAESPASSRRAGAMLAPGDPYLIRPIDRYRRETWRWQQLMGRARTHSTDTARTSRDPEYRRWVLRLWRARAAKLRRLGERPPHRRAWLCIQRYEARWQDPHAPYYGGLQMDLRFQRLYGHFLLRRKGTANRWSPVEQMWVAERALRAGRGFHPWPRTARSCGLL
jgi:hypothetical protein